MCAVLGLCRKTSTLRKGCCVEQNTSSITSRLAMHSTTSTNHPQNDFQPSKTTLLLLPTEIQDSIISFLPYPDLLALKHTHPHFYRIVVTTKHQRTAWLSERAEQRLPLPQRTCRWNTDADFCRSEEIREFMERRRWHLDCPGEKPGGGCLVVEGKDCFSIKVRSVGRWHGALVADVAFERSKPHGGPQKRNRALDLMLALIGVALVPVAFAMWSLRHQLAIRPNSPRE